MSGIRKGRPAMRGSSKLRPRTLAETAAVLERPSQDSRVLQGGAGKKRILFVCIGNSCRSQMAEAFARAYGADIVDASSAGLSPASIIMPLTRKVLADRNISASGQFPKGMETTTHQHYDVVVNMSGQPVNTPGARILRWNVPDPVGHNQEVYRRVAEQIEELVMRLVIELRSSAR